MTIEEQQRLMFDVLQEGLPLPEGDEVWVTSIDEVGVHGLYVTAADGRALYWGCSNTDGRPRSDFVQALITTFESKK